MRIGATLLAALACTLPGCATVVLEGTTTTAPAATSTVPTGTPAELLGRLRDAASALGAAVGARDKAAVAAGSSEVEALWEALAPLIGPAGEKEDLERIIALVRGGAARKRAADIDKAVLLLGLVIEARQQ